MVFYACCVIYTVKELDSHAKHGQRVKKNKNDLDVEWRISVPNTHFPVSYNFGKVFFEHGSS